MAAAARKAAARAGDGDHFTPGRRRATKRDRIPAPRKRALRSHDFRCTCGGWCCRGVVARRPQDNCRGQSSLDGEVEGALSELRRVDEATAAQQAGGLPPSRRTSSSWTGGRLVSRELRTTAAPGRRRRRQQRLRVTTTAAATAARPTATRPRHYQSQQYSLLLKGE